MDNELKNRLKGTLIVHLGLAIVLAPFSIFVGWNLATMILFWFVILPGLTVYLPTLVSTSKHHLFASVAGLAIFYIIIIFMIYDHYKTDYFQIMMISGVINAIAVSVIIRTRKLRAQVQ